MRCGPLCVGISDYWSQGIADLQYAETDAQAMAELLERDYGYRVERLLGTRATRAVVLESLERYRRELGPNDALVLYFAGHGQTVPLPGIEQTGFLVPFDAQLDLDDTRDPDEWAAQAIDMRELRKIAMATRARHVLIIADACYSGFLGKRSGLTDPHVTENILVGRSRAVMTAGTKRQEAFERSQLGHGVFTHMLLQQLRSGFPAGATELFLSARRGVLNYTEERQQPQFSEFRAGSRRICFSATEGQRRAGGAEGTPSTCARAPRPTNTVAGLVCCNDGDRLPLRDRRPQPATRVGEAAQAVSGQCRSR